MHRQFSVEILVFRQREESFISWLRNSAVSWNRKCQNLSRSVESWKLSRRCFRLSSRN